MRLIIFLLLEPIKRILSAVIYPIAYIFRDRMVTKQVLFYGYLYQYKPAWFLLWLFENDSERFDYLYGIPTGEKYYPKWLYNACYKLDTWWKRFLMAYWFNGIRNSMVNWNNWVAYRLGKFEGIIADYGEIDFLVLRDKRKGYRLEIRMFENGIRPYLEFYLFGRWFQIGWLNGAACRFEIDLFKKK